MVIPTFSFSKRCNSCQGHIAHEIGLAILVKVKSIFENSWDKFTMQVSLFLLKIKPCTSKLHSLTILSLIDFTKVYSQTLAASRMARPSGMGQSSYNLFIEAKHITTSSTQWDWRTMKLLAAGSLCIHFQN